ncbi:MAG: shikimate kinase [Tannerellaceae bacterium]|jgi:shikimate kinase|nr:shikimate kinase [Tannerellaceae bacterium]
MKRIFLIGYMGAGKTTIGKELSKRMNLSFVDLDAYIEARYYKTVSRIFAEKGEEAFRKIECNILREVATFENVLISTGGGTPCFHNNMTFMNEAGKTVYVKVSPAELVKRLSPVKHTRPVLNGRSGADLLSFVSENLLKRTPYYMQATIVFDVETMDTENDIHRSAQVLEKVLLQ